MQKKSMVKLIIIITLLSLTMIISAGFMLTKKDKNEYNTVTVEKINIKNVISATGTINTKGTVEVGTQVSGTVSEVFVDYNDNVKKGQLLAKLDTTLLNIAVKQSEAKLMSIKSQYHLSLKEYENKKELFKDSLISKYEFETVKVSKEEAYANLLFAETDLDKYQANLEYASIYSPIDGIIIDKDVEQGQTVASNFSSPTLFIIAEDLANLEIHASVDESDINNIKKNQSVDFYIEFDTDNILTGTVREIRLNAQITSNVVTYTVVIDATNQDNLLLPGMTATLDFIISQKSDVWALPNAAVRFRPTEVMMEIVKDKMPPTRPELPKNNLVELQDIETTQNENVMLWYIDEDDKINMLFAKKGLSDDTSIEIIGLGDEQLKYLFITGIVSTSEIKSVETKSNLMNEGLQGGGQQRPNGPPPGM